MLKTGLACLSATLLTAAAMTQNCIVPVGTVIGVGPDVVLPMQPIGFPFPLAGATYTSIHISDKGHAFLSNAGVPTPPSSADFTATAIELVTGVPRLCPLWSDIQVLSGNNGHVYLDSTSTQCTVTWENAQIFNNGLSGGTLFNLQMRLYPSGLVLFSYGGSASNGSVAIQPAWQEGIVGISPGGGTTPPSSMDLSTSPSTVDNTIYQQFSGLTSFDLQGTQLLMVPLNPGWAVAPPAPNGCAAKINFGQGCTGTSFALTTNGLPTLGNAAFALTVSGVPNLAPLGVMFFGDAPIALPGLSLGFLGMAGCQAYTDATLGAFSFPVTLPAGTGSLPFPMPSSPTVIGITLTAQAVAFSTLTTLGLLTSNGTKFYVGT